jgi:hypothetical protein
VMPQGRSIICMAQSNTNRSVREPIPPACP